MTDLFYLTHVIVTKAVMCELFNSCIGTYTFLKRSIWINFGQGVDFNCL